MRFEEMSTEVMLDCWVEDILQSEGYMCRSWQVEILPEAEGST